MLMKDLVEKVNEGLTELVQPYLGKQEYGSLDILSINPNNLPSMSTTRTVMWFLMYRELTFTDGALGETANAIVASYNIHEGMFKFSRSQQNGTVKTDEPQKVVDYFRERLQSIKPKRLEVLQQHARKKKGQLESLTAAIEELRKFAKGHPEYGPTEDELQEYRVFFDSLLTRGWT